MLNLLKSLIAIAVLSTSIFARADVKGELIQYNHGVLKLRLDTCGDQTTPKVDFKPVEEVASEGAFFGTYFAKISVSEIPPDMTCPMSMPSIFTFDLIKLYKEWSASAEGSPISKSIVANNGSVEIVVSGMRLNVNVQKGKVNK